MTDRELLEAAAKAAGYEIQPHPNGRLFPGLLFRHCGANWNPLTDDGDALRLAVKLRLEVSWWRNALTVETDDKKATSGIVGIGDDPYAATRRAIVRAAAAMVKP